VEMDLPGFTKGEIKIECDKGNLTVKASKEEKQDDEERNYIKRERVYNEYSRSFYLADIDEENINAKFEDGTLTITVPKRQEIETKRHIEID
ncbi:MAG: Hsp20 family protein, partial [Romboutsia sp.]|nr:Hsp20 family protein [Romboutsia sp.]